MWVVGLPLSGTHTFLFALLRMYLQFNWTNESKKTSLRHYKISFTDRLNFKSLIAESNNRWFTTVYKNYISNLNNSKSMQRISINEVMWLTDRLWHKTAWQQKNESWKYARVYALIFIATWVHEKLISTAHWHFLREPYRSLTFFVYSASNDLVI